MCSLYIFLLFGRLKNSESLLYKSMETYDTRSCVILTGTPVQNNLSEMYALLSFVCPDVFKLSDKEQFLAKYKNVKSDEKGESCHCMFEFAACNEHLLLMKSCTFHQLPCGSVRLLILVLCFTAAESLQQLIKPYLLRRTKAMVALDIPEKSEVTIYHPISDLQKKYYKAILTKDAG